MANKLDLMDIRQLIQLHADGLSNRKIGQTLGIHRNTINDYIRRLKATTKTAQELLKLADEELREFFPSHTTINNERYAQLMTFLERVHRARHYPGFTFQYHHREYVNTHENPYSETQFIEHYRRKYSREKGSMKLEHLPGNELFIDYAGKKLHIVDKQTGELKEVEVFIAILPNSQYTYVEACYSQKRADLIACISNTLSFYGGVPKAIVSDNLKSAVTRACKYEPEINRSLKELAQHYGCAINPTRAYSPQDKALVENAVNLTYQRIYHPLREMTFFSLEELNQQIRILLNRYNDQLFQRKQASRKELFQSIEQGYLKPLTATRYELKDYRRAKVQKMGYVYFSPDKTYYSVPYRYIGKHTQIHYTQNVVEVYFNHKRIAIHHRNHVSGSYITNKDHLCSSHKAYMEWSPDYFKKKALKHGQAVHDFVSGLLDGYDYPEVNYRRITGVLLLSNEYGSERLNKACERAMYADTFSYHMIKNILKNNLDGQAMEQSLGENSSHIPKHENIRGADYYKQV